MLRSLALPLVLACATPSLVAKRPYRAETPPAYDGRTALVEVHGYDDDAESIERLLRLRDTAQRHGALLVRVEGTANPDGHRFWNTGKACCDLHGDGPDDLAYLDAVLDDLAARHHASRVFLVGHSNGGFLVHAYACAHAERLAGIASLAGAGPAESCRPRAPLAVLQIHGDADPLVGLQGGNVQSAFRILRELHGLHETGSAPTADYPPLADTLQVWAARDECRQSQTRMDASLAATVTSVTEWSCRKGGVALWLIHGGGHEPALKDAWGERLWSFFTAR